MSNSYLTLTFDGSLAAKLGLMYEQYFSSVFLDILYSMLLLLMYAKDWSCFQCVCIRLSWMSGVSLSLFSFYFCSLWTTALLACQVLEWCG